MNAAAVGIYMLCVLTSVTFAILLLRQYFRSRARLLFWSGLCFICIATGDIVLFFDMIILPAWDLSALRHGITLLGVLLLLFGLIWETKRDD